LKKKDTEKASVRNVTATGIDFDGHTIRVVTLSRDAKGDLRFDGYAKKKILLFDEEVDEGAHASSLAENLKSLLETYRPSLGRIISDLSRNVVATRNIRLPSQNEEEIREMLHYDVERHVPVPADELEVGFQILARADDLHSQVLLLAAPRKDVDLRLQTLNEAGLKVEEIHMDALGVARSFKQLALANPVLCIINLRNDVTDLLILKDGDLYFSRCIPIGIDHLTHFSGEETELGDSLFDFQDPPERIKVIQEEWLDKLCLDLHRSIHAFQNELFGESLERVSV